MITGIDGAGDFGGGVTVIDGKGKLPLNDGFFIRFDKCLEREGLGLGAGLDCLKSGIGSTSSEVAEPRVVP